MKKETKSTILKLLLTALVLGGVFVVVYSILKELGLSNLDQEHLQEMIGATGAVAPLVYLLVCFLQIILIPVPGSVVVLAGNYLFGPLEAFIYSYVGMICGSMVAFWLGKLLGRPFVNWIAGGKEKVDEWLLKLRGKEAVLIFFMFLFPLFPDDLLCAVAGLLHFKSITFFTMQLVTRASSVFGTMLFMTGDIIPLNAWGIPVLVLLAFALIGLFVVSIRNAEKIDNYFSSLVRKVYYGEEYFLKIKPGYVAGKPVFINKKFKTKACAWRLGAVYICDEGYVVDCFSLYAPKNHLPEKDFETAIRVEDRDIECADFVHHVSAPGRKWVPKKIRKRISEFNYHYKLDPSRHRVFIRLFFADDSDKTELMSGKFLFVVKATDKEGNIVEQKIDLTAKQQEKTTSLKELFISKRKKKAK